MKNIKLLVVLVLTLILLPSVTSLTLVPWYERDQKVTSIDEQVFVSKDSLRIEIRANLWLDDTIYNETNWSIFEFYPKLDETDEVINYSENLSAAFIRTGNESRYIYNVSLSELKKQDEWNRHNLFFRVDYVLKRPLVKTLPDFSYDLVYVTNFDAETRRIYFSIENPLALIDSPETNGKKLSTLSPYYEVKGNEQFTARLKMEDTAEKKAHELQGVRLNLLLAALAFAVGILGNLAASYIWHNVECVWWAKHLVGWLSLILTLLAAWWLSHIL